jgi:hypothetical protein
VGLSQAIEKKFDLQTFPQMSSLTVAVTPTGVVLTVYPVPPLQTDDMDQFAFLKQTLAQSFKNSMRSDSSTQFRRMIRVINNFILRHDQGQTARSCACGVFFFPDFICVNVQCLKTTFGVSRSLINKRLEDFQCRRLTGDALLVGRALLQAVLDPMDLQPGVLKQWTIRNPFPFAVRTTLGLLPPARIESAAVSVPGFCQPSVGTPIFPIPMSDPMPQLLAPPLLPRGATPQEGKSVPRLERSPPAQLIMGMLPARQ